MAQPYFNMEEGMGKEKLHFSLLKLAKCQKGPLGKSVSTNFVTNVANNCCGVTEGSEQQHNQDLKEIYKG